MKRMLGILLVLIMLSPITVVGQETEKVSLELPDAGITPDSSLYFLDIAMENIELALTFNSDAKMEKKLQIATKRLAEAKEMASEGKVEAMGKAVERHNKIIQQLMIEVEEIVEEDFEEASVKTEFKNKIKEHKELVKALKVEIEIENEGKLTGDEKEQIDKLLNSSVYTLEDHIREVELISTMDQIMVELSIDFNGEHEILSSDFDVEGDTLSGSVEARTNEVMDLNALKDQLLAGTSGWKSGDVSVEGDSLDIDFEKDYPVVEIEGVKYIPSSSVSLSVTVHEDDGFSDSNYDIDITLEEVDGDDEKAMFDELRSTMDQIMVELSIDFNGEHEILSSDFDVEGNTLSGSVETRTNEVMDLNALKDQLLTGTSGWKSDDVSVEGDSLDIEFEKDYPVVEIEGVEYIPSSSVSLSVTVYEDDGFSDSNYDIDITLEEVEDEEGVEKEG